MVRVATPETAHTKQMVQEYSYIIDLNITHTTIIYITMQISIVNSFLHFQFHSCVLQINMYRSKRKDSLQWETKKLQSIVPICQLLADVKEGTQQK